ncbi:SAF domain-containing protein [Pseudonocardia sp. HH130630-07]|uniref:SAF domain-containing protein n=1 Tax=Pseudonocardia sp. HH130630-07 TaxID=1690815 RepID=UPI0008153193|nr:SAF domain-containing protein [Pseudonocardia sp. HH130630-07]ANY06129.1 hypothetical protein AFB00_07255 [Pseudonocardia sp. HH130630-07]
MDEGDRGPRARWERTLRGAVWSRTLLLRRLAALALAVAAVVVAVLPAAADERGDVLVAARDLEPGTVLRPADVRPVAWPAALVPGGALRVPAEADGRTVAGPVRSGEALTDLRLVGPETAVRTGGPGASAVPVRPADPAVAALLSPGVRVDVISEDDGGPRVLAARAGVVAVLPAAGAAGTAGARGPLVLIALPEPEANAVAAATLSGEVAVTLR